MNAFPRYAKMPHKWIGKTVETAGNHRGEVQYAVLTELNTVELYIEHAASGEIIFSDDEHATMVRTLD